MSTATCSECANGSGTGGQACPRCDRRLCVQHGGGACDDCERRFHDGARLGRWFLLGFAAATIAFGSMIADVRAWFPGRAGLDLIDCCASVIATGAAMIGFAVVWLRGWLDRRRFLARTVPIARARWRGRRPTVALTEMPGVRW